MLILAARLPAIPLEWSGALVSAGYLAALGMLWFNRDRPWFRPLVAGVALNTIVIMANGGRMPVLPIALSGISPFLPSMWRLTRLARYVDPRHLLASPSTTLAFLGDSLPVQIGGFGAVVSPGDVLMAIGVAGYIQAQMYAARLPRDLSGAPAPPAA